MSLQVTEDQVEREAFAKERDQRRQLLALRDAIVDEGRLLVRHRPDKDATVFNITFGGLTRQCTCTRQFMQHAGPSIIAAIVEDAAWSLARSLYRE